MGQMDREHGIVEKELMNGRVAREMTEARKEARKGPRAPNPIGTATRIKEARERARAKARVNPYKWANSIDEEDDQTLSWESEPEGENAEELASLETPDEEGEWCWPKKSRVTRWRRKIDHDQHSTTSLKTMKVSKRPKD